MRLSSCLALLAAAPLFAGCINTDTAVFVDPSIETPVLTVSKIALGTTVTGSFTLKLHLGARASGGSMVTMGELEIQDSQKTKALIAPLVVDAGSTPMPVPVAPDSDAVVPFKIDTGTKPLLTQVGTDLCDAGSVVITGTIQDSLQDTATPVESPVFQVAGCM
jgi:hypothetical protein